MKQYHFIDSRHDKFGNYQILWSHGNYVYEIEDQTAGKKFVFVASFEGAKALFQEICEGY